MWRGIQLKSLLIKKRRRRESCAPVRCCCQTPESFVAKTHRSKTPTFFKKLKLFPLSSSPFLICMQAFLPVFCVFTFGEVFFGCGFVAADVSAHSALLLRLGPHQSVNHKRQLAPQAPPQPPLPSPTPLNYHCYCRLCTAEVMLPRLSLSLPLASSVLKLFFLAFLFFFKIKSEPIQSSAKFY